MLPVDVAVCRALYPAAQVRPSGGRRRMIFPAFNDHVLRNCATYADSVDLKVRYWIRWRKLEGNRATMERGVRRQRHVRGRIRGTPTDRSRHG